LLAYTQEGVEAAHPSLEGKNVLETKDKKNGSFFVKEQIKIANNGGGYLTYWWTLPNSEKVSEKITYQKADPNWGWVVSAGTYMSDFNIGTNKIFNTTIIILLSILVLGSVVIIIFAQHIAVPIKRIGKAVDVVASGNFSLPDLDIKNKDESTGSFSQTFHCIFRHGCSSFWKLQCVVLSSFSHRCGIFICCSILCCIWTCRRICVFLHFGAFKGYNSKGY
jgi:methyl-accepting chemotaxis protein